VCGDPVVVLDVSPMGAKARVSGIAQRALAGEKVTILRAGKPAGTATVGADGAFAATVIGGPATEAEPVRYQATVGKSRSRAFRYDRRVRITKRTGVKVTGKLTLKKRPKTATLYRENVCTKQRVATTLKLSKSGTFSFTMRGPDAGSPYVLYRVSAKLGGAGKTFSTQIAVTS
jgi:hypothetical protein